MGLIQGMIMAGIKSATDVAEAKATINNVIKISTVSGQTYKNYETFSDGEQTIDRDLFISVFMDEKGPSHLWDYGGIKELLEKELKNPGKTGHSIELWDALLTVRYFMDEEESYTPYLKIARLTKFASKAKLDEIEKEYIELKAESDKKHAEYENYIANTPRPVQQRDDELTEQIEVLSQAKNGINPDNLSRAEIRNRLSAAEKEKKQISSQLKSETTQFLAGATPLKKAYEKFDAGRFFIVKGVHDILLGTADSDLTKKVDLFKNHYAEEIEQDKISDIDDNELVLVSEKSHENVIFYCSSCNKAFGFNNRIKYQRCNCGKELTNTRYPLYEWQLRLAKEKEYLKDEWAAGNFSLTHPKTVEIDAPVEESSSGTAQTLPAEPSTTDWIFCYKCGNRIPADSVFCNKCGTKQPVNSVQE